MKRDYKILSVGGSILIPKEGFNTEFLKGFRKLIIEQVKKGQKFILVIGGGATCRSYQNALKGTIAVTEQDLDHLGIYTTHFNAEFVRMLFKDFAYKEVIKNLTKKIATAKPIIVTGGWKPGCSTDKDAVLFAKYFGAQEIYNLSNVNYIYDSNPSLNSQAQRFLKISWNELQKIVGTTWKPGLSVPFDPMATKLAKKMSLKVNFVQGTNLVEVKNALQGVSHQGTVIV
jgi:uridylate kinase